MFRQFVRRSGARGLPYSMQTQLRMTYFAVLFVALALFLILYDITSQTLLEITSSHSGGQLAQINESLENFLTNIDNISMSLISNRQIKESLNETDARAVVEKARFINSILHSLYISNQAMMDIQITDNAGNTYGVVCYPNDPITLSRFAPYLERARQAKGKNLWLGLHEYYPLNTFRSQAYTFPIFPTIASFTDYFTGESLGILILDIRAETLKRMLTGASLGARDTLYLLDENKRVLLSGDGKTDFELGAELAADSGEQLVMRGGTQYLLTYVRNQRTGWYLAKLVSTDTLMHGGQRVRNVFLALEAALLAFGIVSSVWFSRRMTREVGRISDVIGRVKGGDFDARISSARKDEMGAISDEIDRLIGGMQALIQNLSQQKAMAAEARFRSLQAQISPHFIYNSLDTINWKLIGMGQTELSDMIVALSSLLRYTVNSAGDFVPMRAELEHIANYILVCNHCMSNRIRYTPRLTTDVERLMVPRLLIQPIVENAVKHGVGDLIAGGEIILRVYESDGRVLIEVENEGAPPDMEKIERILSGDPLEKEAGIGLRNVQQRIRAIYGGENVLRYRRSARGTTLATLVIGRAPGVTKGGA